MRSSNGETKTNGPFSFYKYRSNYFAAGEFVIIIT